MREFYEFRGETTKKICKETVFAHEFCGDNQYLGAQVSNCNPVAPSLLLSLGHNIRLGGTILVLGAQAVIWEARPRNVPRGDGPAATSQQFIEL